MKPNYITSDSLQHFIQEALKEDLGSGDHSSLSSIPNDLTQKAKLLVKEDCILAGIEMAKEIFLHYDSNLKMEIFLEDGVKAKAGDIAFIVEGNAQSILSTERLVLNCMQRMSGIASLTFQMNELVKHTHCKILDTRKTTPNFRLCEKWAVLIGGGTNHRYGLYDMIMLKDNHIDYNGSITKAVEQAYNYKKEKGLEIKIEVETRNLKEVEEALNTKKVDRILLDNMPINLLESAVLLINKQVESEASGGITQKNLKKIAETGVDFVSMGALTHSAKNIDLSLKAIKE